VTAPFLALLAALLLGPVPSVLASARWPARTPRAAIVLWQAIGLVAGLASIGALVVAGLAPLGRDLPTVAASIDQHLATGATLPRLGTDNVAALLAAAGITAWLAGHLLYGTWLMERRRHHYRATIDVLTQRYLPDGSQVVADRRPLAYSLPGRDWRLVVTDGALDVLGEDELAAVLAHERAHLRARHDLVLLPFATLVRAFPLASLRTAHGAVASLVEMDADDHAAASCGASATAAALRRMRPSLQPDTHVTHACQARHDRADQRLARLTTGRALTSPWLAPVVCLVAVALLIVPAVAVL